MSGKAGFSSEQPDNPTHGHAIPEGISTAFSWLTVLPFRGSRVFDRTTGRRAMLAMPLVGLFHGLVAWCVFTLTWLLQVNFGHTLDLWVVAFGIVSLWEFSTRLMHIDGLSDVADALGSYAPPPKARGILADTNAGPMGVAAIVFSVAAQIIGVHAIMQGAGSTTLSDVGHFPASDFPVSTVIGLILVPTVARISALILCTEGYRPANPTGFGALVIGTVPKLGTAAWVTTAAIAAFVGGGILWTLMTLAVIALTIPWALHCRRRFDGLAGDCLGATIEIATAATVVLFSLTA
ncbi:adenosylcobinamide-GDP ribazoletransferase [Corynebacterium sp. MC-04]|uniref:Adenosylcobinamide-GDP ribazoletransferase n=1 Tax=Corynebacterium parakroppenstedtii TaxID=2828363 RepID=A0ABS9HLN4_9CORY|nr:MULTISPECIES: adenosylcobinamide-GDP ribazoletransferase [Corynebacterium]KXB50481.1 cobalamin-5-phosphate synthase [Corynebacterium kroppenstedtii]MBY0789123.1 adenosylcobinamide-GDP ribazoletransferase [Corynebacterium parakroppenstedtii]MBY0793186.1 adenosylcobinamide-GDP ribazoletransferase [Corynebacterium parakroppenstedtii]MBY0795509.1 adenosylcobinamide-GDP ribazoletransferase [Corynebacterium parakroppenstedtii]MBY0797572.1 adenosylcobinamide-GDP ribazoletransferase [Corynebacteriu